MNSGGIFATVSVLLSNGYGVQAGFAIGSLGERGNPPRPNCPPLLLLLLRLGDFIMGLDVERSRLC